MYKELGDTEDLEQLDNLLDGQTHRIRSLLQGNNSRNNDIGIKSTETLSMRRPERSSGRGGGVIGTRGRGSMSSIGNRTTQGAVSKLGNQIIETSRKGNRGLDPALDPDGDQKGGGFKSKYKPGGKKQPPAFLRTRRVAPMPAGDYSRLLSSPDDFLAVARSMVRKPPPDNTKASDIASPKEQKPVQDTKAQGAVVTAKNLAPSSTRRHGNTAPSAVDVKTVPAKEVAVPTTAPVAGRPPALRVLTSTPERPKTEGRSKGTSLPSSGQVTSSSKTGNGQAEGKSSLLKGLTANLPQPILSRQEGISRGHEKDKTKREKVELLVDFDSSPDNAITKNSMANMDQSFLRSPVFDDLEGIDFSIQNTTDTTLSLKPPSSRFPFSCGKKLDFKQDADEKKDSDVAAVSNADDDEHLSKYRRGLSMIDNLMEIKALPDEYLYKLEECRKALESRLTLADQPFTAQPVPSKPEQPARAGNPREALRAGPSINKPGTDDERAKDLEKDKSPIQEPTDQSGSIMQSPPLSENRLRYAVTAPEFIPRKPSFTKYRSPTHSISSDSSASSDLPSLRKVLQPNSPSPGDKAKVLSPLLDPSTSPSLSKVKVIAPLPGQPTSSSPGDKVKVIGPAPSPPHHIFGDHLFPRRRTAQDSQTEASPSRPASSSDKPKFQISIPPQRSVLSEAQPSFFEGLGISMSTNIIESQKGKARLFSPDPETKPLTPTGVPLPESSKEESNITPTKTQSRAPSLTLHSSGPKVIGPGTSHASQESVHAPHNSQQSIPAPKLCQPSVLTPNPTERRSTMNRSVSGGLQGPTWASDENNKPSR
ncbi:hypothetical protein MAP00_001841 [Monascus purpureus]|nr:hypothetical protein MAP00_001841 [Monascus purpureus]